MRIIDAEALVERAEVLEDFFVVNWTTKKVQCLINAAPTIDAVPVVRCKDCKYNHISLAFSRGGVWCECWGTTPDPDGFCHKGERRSDD